MRLLWTADTNVPTVHSPADIWAWITMVEWYSQGKLLILPPDRSLAILPAKLSSSKTGENGEGHDKFSLTKYIFHTSKGSFHAITSHDMGPMALLPLRRKACWGFLSPSPGFELANLGSNYKHANHKTKEDDIQTFTYLPLNLIICFYFIYDPRGWKSEVK
jgi:hypothetical protein